MKKLVNEDMEGVSSPVATLSNVPGVGNAVPASTVAMSGAQQSSSSCIGSGDKWGAVGQVHTQEVNKKKKKKKAVIKEENISAYDRIGIAMAKKMKVPMIFKKKNSRINTIVTKHFDNKMVKESVDTYLNEIKKNSEHILVDLKIGKTQAFKAAYRIIKDFNFVYKNSVKSLDDIIDIMPAPSQIEKILKISGAKSLDDFFWVDEEALSYESADNFTDGTYDVYNEYTSNEKTTDLYNYSRFAQLPDDVMNMFDTYSKNGYYVIDDIAGYSTELNFGQISRMLSKDDKTSYINISFYRYK